MRHTMSDSRSGKLLILTLVFLTATSVQAGPRDHQDGFFLRLSAGGGSAKTSLEGNLDEIEISGPAGDLNIAIGGIVAPNLALHGTLFGWSTNDPDVEVNGSYIGRMNGDMTAGGMGIGLTYYFMPVNLYLSGSVGFGSMELRLAGPSGETDTGLFTDLTVGKEWWVGDKWGLGIAGGMEYHSFGDPDINKNWSGTSWTIRFTATMN